MALKKISNNITKKDPKSLKNNILIITGPTAVGKSEVAIECAKLLDGEIISADSIQIYKDLNIGTAKLSLTEQQGIPHYLIDIRNFTETYNVWQFVKDASALIDDILRRNKTPIICGGTTLYIKALVENYDFDGQNVSSQYYERHNIIDSKLSEFEENDNFHITDMYENLKLKSPEIAKKINPKDQQRIKRALEKNEILKLESLESKEAIKKTYNKEYNFIIFSLNIEREILYARINSRVESMIKKGMIEEVKQLITKGLNLNMQAGKSIGYKEFMEFFNGDKTLEEAVDKFKQHTRNYAKRQITFTKTLKNVFYIDSMNKIATVSEIIKIYEMENNKINETNKF